MTKKFTAKQMHHAPAQVFRAADRDGKAEIEHSHYKDRVFELTARDRDLKSFNVCAKCKKERPKTESGISDCCDSFFITTPRQP